MEISTRRTRPINRDVTRGEGEGGLVFLNDPARSQGYSLTGQGKQNLGKYGQGGRHLKNLHIHRLEPCGGGFSTALVPLEGEDHG